MNKKYILTVFIFFIFPSVCFSQQFKDKYIYIDSIEVFIEKTIENEYHHQFEIAIHDIGHLIDNTSNDEALKNLSGCFIFIAASTEKYFSKPKGFIGVYKEDSIVWKSGPLSRDLSTLGGIVAKIGDLNGDGKLEIVISQDELPGTSKANYLWIFRWDEGKGKLITETNNEGETVLAFFGEYVFIDTDDDGILEIQGEWYKDDNMDKTTMVTYSWNGLQYGKWGATSKYLVKKGIKK